MTGAAQAPDRWMSRLSCTSLSFPTLRLDQVVAVVDALDFTSVDVCIADGSRDVRSDAVCEAPRDTARAHRQLCDRYGIAVADVFAHIGRSALDRPINTADPDTRAQNRERLHNYLLYAAEVGSTGLTISPGEDGPAAAFDRACSELEWAARHASDLGVQLSVEPHLNSITDTVDQALALCTAVPSLRLTLDYSHFLSAGVAQTQVDPLFRHARHAHLRQAKPGHLQCPVDEGVLDVDAMLAAASVAGYAGSFAVEFVHSPAWNMNSLDVLSETTLMRAAYAAATRSGHEGG